MRLQNTLFSFKYYSDQVQSTPVFWRDSFCPPHVTEKLVGTNKGVCLRNFLQCIQSPWNMFGGEEGEMLRGGREEIIFYQQWRDKKVGDEWAEGYKASYHGNKLAGRKEGIRNKIEIRYYLWIFYFLTFSFH